MPRRACRVCRQNSAAGGDEGRDKEAARDEDLISTHVNFLFMGQAPPEQPSTDKRFLFRWDRSLRIVVVSWIAAMKCVWCL
jgi:hypothetical protein